MKQKMRIKVSINYEKCKRKAVEVAVVAKGVISGAVEGDSEDELVVVGDGVDAVCLVDALRKKTWYATLESLEEVKPDPPAADDQMKPQEDGDANMPKNIETIDDNITNHIVPQYCCPAQCSSFSYEQPLPAMYEVVVYDS